MGLTTETESDKSDDNEEKKEKEESDEDVLDKGFAWVIVLGGFLTQFLIGGLMRTDGIFFRQFKKRFHMSDQLTAWPSALTFTVQCFTAPVASAFCNRFSVRTAVHLGTFLLVSGLVATAIAPDLYVLFFSYSVLQGIGRSFVLAPGVYIVNMYFNKRLGMALGLSTSGTGLGLLGMPPFLHWLFHRIGYQMTFLVVAAIATSGWGMAMIFRPLSMHKEIIQERRLRIKNSSSATSETKKEPVCAENDTHSCYGSMSSTSHHHSMSNSILTDPAKHIDLNQNIPSNSETIKSIEVSPNAFKTTDATHNQKIKKHFCRTCLDIIFPIEGVKSGKKRGPLFHWPLFRDIPFMVLCSAMIFYNLAQKTFFTFLPATAVQQGVKEYSLVLSTVGVGETIGRVAAGFILDRPQVRPFAGVAFSLAFISASGAVMIIPFSMTFIMFCVAGFFFGFMVGAIVSQKSTVLVVLTGKETVNSAYGILYAFQGIGTLAGPPVCGALKDAFGQYYYTFYLIGASMFAAGALAALGTLLFAIRKRRLKQTANLK